MEKDFICFMYEYKISKKEKKVKPEVKPEVEPEVEPKPKLKIGRPKKPKVKLNYKIYKPPKEGKTKLEMKRENIRTRLIETQMKADLFRESLQSAK